MYNTREQDRTILRSSLLRVPINLLVLCVNSEIYKLIIYLLLFITLQLNYLRASRKC